MNKEPTINIYTCPDGHKTVTVYLEEGTTPFIIGCQQRINDGKHSCNLEAKSCFYRCSQDLVPTHEWYKPTDLKKLNPAEREHVKKGGLLLRKVPPIPGANPPKQFA